MYMYSEYVLYCMFGPCAKAVLPLAHRHSQVGVEIHIQLIVRSFTCHPIHDMGPILLMARQQQYMFVGSAGTRTLNLLVRTFR